MGVGRGVEEATCCIEGAVEADLPEDSCRGAGGLDSEDSPSFALFAFEDFSDGPLLNFTKSGAESSRSSNLKSEMSTPSSFRRWR